MGVVCVAGRMQSEGDLYQLGQYGKNVTTHVQTSVAAPTLTCLSIILPIPNRQGRFFRRSSRAGDDLLKNRLCGEIRENLR